VELANPETERSKETNRRFDVDKKWMDVKFDLLLEVDVRAAETSRLEVLNQAEQRVRELASAFGRTMGASANRLAEKLADDFRGQELFPWLPSPSRQIVVNGALDAGFLAKRFDLSIPLVGQRAQEIDVTICTVQLEPYSPIEEGFTTEDYESPEKMAAKLERLAPDPAEYVQLMRVSVESVIFQEGSLFSWIEVHVQTLVLAATLLTAGTTIIAIPAGDYLNKEIRIYQLDSEISSVLKKNQPMVKYRNFNFSPQELNEIGGRAFNYEERGISDDEKRHRIALVQLALNIELRINLVIDGQIGPETERAIAEFSKNHHHPASVTNPFLQADFLDVLIPRH
jgi:hypothetical protein